MLLILGILAVIVKILSQCSSENSDISNKIILMISPFVIFDALLFGVLY